MFKGVNASARTGTLHLCTVGRFDQNEFDQTMDRLGPPVGVDAVEMVNPEPERRPIMAVTRTFEGCAETVTEDTLLTYAAQLPHASWWNTHRR